MSDKEDFERTFSKERMVTAKQFVGQAPAFAHELNAGSNELRRLFRAAVMEAESDAGTGLNGLFGGM